MSKKTYTSEEASKIKNKSPLTFKKSDQLSFFDVPDNTEPLSPTSVPCIVQIRLLDGSVQKAQFQSENTLEVIAQYILQVVKKSEEYTQQGFAITVPFPKKIRYDAEGIKKTTLKEACLSPNGTVIVEKLQQGIVGWKPAEKAKIEDVTYKTFYLASDTKLRGDNPEAKEAFEKRMREQEVATKEAEKKKKKQDLDRVRAMLKEREKKPTTATTTTTTTSKQPAAPTKVVDSCTIRIQFPDGAKCEVQLHPSSKLMQVHQELSKLGKVADTNYSFVTAVPRKVLDYKDWNLITLESAGLSPKGVLTILPETQKGQLHKGTTPAPAPASNDEAYDDYH